MPRATEHTDEGKARGSTLDSAGIRQHFTVQDTVEVNEGDKKRIVFQYIRFDNGREQFRLGYYVLGRKGDMKDKWVWARSTPLINPEHLSLLLRKAKERGWYPSAGEA